MIERCSNKLSLDGFRILVEMLFTAADLLWLVFEIVWIISSFVHGEIKNQSWLDGGKYSEKRFI